MNWGQQGSFLTSVNSILCLWLHDNYFGVHVCAATSPSRWSVENSESTLMAEKLDLARSEPHYCHCINLPHCSTLNLLTTLRPIQIRQQFAVVCVPFLRHTLLCRLLCQLQAEESHHLLTMKNNIMSEWRQSAAITLRKTSFFSLKINIIEALVGDPNYFHKFFNSSHARTYLSQNRD